MPGSDLSGQLIDRRYQVEERIAEGAMGVVYRATRLKLDRAVAIKVMHHAIPGELAGQKRFEREAKLMARLEHPHCVSIIDFGLHGTKPYVVMELVRGRSLYDMIAELGKLEIPRAVDIMKQVLSGLAHAHEQGIIHRDIKPANIMTTPKAPLGVHARILDFGLARMVGSSASLSDGVAVGTPSYMSPEQCRGEELDQRVDIYACGVVLFEMLTGRKPFVANEPIAIIKKALQEPAPRLADISPGDYGGLEAVVARALAKSPADRYPSAVAMAEALDAALGGGSRASDSTAEFPKDAMQPEPTADVPITVGSSVRVLAETAPAQPIRKPESHDNSSIRKMLPPSRMKWAALLIVLLAGGAIVGIVMLQRELAKKTPATTPPVARDATAVVATSDAPPDHVHDIMAAASQLAAGGNVDKAIDTLLDAKRVYPKRAELPLLAGKLYFSKLWWTDGVANFREAVKIDPALKSDPALLDIVVKGFITTPGFDSRIGNFVVEIGAPAIPLLDAVARDHANPGIRARASAMSKRLSSR